MNRDLCIQTMLLLAALLTWPVSAASLEFAPQERMVEGTIESHKTYADPFNDVDVDVIFSREGESWRVPTFWRGGQRWTVRFAPPVPGTYQYHLESTDRSNPDLNGQEGQVTIAPYTGSNSLLKHGMLRVSANHRYLEQADGTPFYWLGDTWWTGLSSRLSWEGFQRLTADRKAKGFTVVQIVAGLVPHEEQAPSDPGYCNEGGCVWEPGYSRINPEYFDYADRRIQHLVDAKIVPAIVGAWNEKMGEMGIERLKKHWRYIIARYGAYPVVWILGGEVFDPPPEVTRRIRPSFRPLLIQRGWTDLGQYVRALDPYHHPLTAHERTPPFDDPLQDDSLLNFDLVQSGHLGWGSIASEVAQIDMHYARSLVTRPVVEGEIGYENLGGIHHEDFQRTAFWLSMLNGAAGHTYGANGVWEAYTDDKPLQRTRWSFSTWEEGMRLPGSYEVGLGAKFLRQYSWWRFAPHPEWVVPRGTTLLEPRANLEDADLGRALLSADVHDPSSVTEALEMDYPGGEWAAKHGNFRLPYAAGIPGEVRIIYSPPQLSILPAVAPTVLRLEQGIPYHAFFWEPSTGIRIDLGVVERPPPGKIVFAGDWREADSAWDYRGRFTSARGRERSALEGDILSTLAGVRERNVVASVDVMSRARVTLVLRYHDAGNFVAAIYSPQNQSLFLLDRSNGVDGRHLGETHVPNGSSKVILSAEVREDKAVASIFNGISSSTTPIVDVKNVAEGNAGFLRGADRMPRDHYQFELRESPELVQDKTLDRHLYDAQGNHRGELSGPGWGNFGRDKFILLDAYRPERLPTAGDWVLVLDTPRSLVSSAPSK
jgi:Protein of unknown function (DUF4038)/Domain of unknown function (DUF5060)